MDDKIKYSKKQINSIAIMWAAATIHNAGCDSFTDDFPQDEEVVNMMKVIAKSLLSGLPLFNSLEDIINHAKTIN